MKKILTVYTGGTICTAPTGEWRALAPSLAKRALLAAFAESDSPYAPMAEELFVDSMLPEDNMTLSENMTLGKLWSVIKHIKEQINENYCGVTVMHGTDTLAYSAAFFSMLFSDIDIPIMLVSGNRPPMDGKSNAGDNFRTAVELIMNGIAPNVYVPYRNQDGVMYLHLGSRIMQCTAYSEDFFSAGGAMNISDAGLLKDCQDLSASRGGISTPRTLTEGVSLIFGYTGLDYSRISLEGVKAVLHGTYHSGTVCVERGNEREGYSSCSVLYLAEQCKAKGIPLFASPCVLDGEQYSSAYDMVKNGGICPLDMTAEAAYAKLTVGISAGLEGRELAEFMQSRVNNEFVDRKIF